MDFSAANVDLWHPIIQIGIISGLLLVANTLRRKVAFIRNSLMPTSVLAGFILLLLRYTNIVNMGTDFLEVVTYHALALGFIALSLRTSDKKESNVALVKSKSGALIVSTYLVQAIVGLIISIGLGLTFMPNLFKASGILLPMAYGQGPGQANNVGTTYEGLGMVGGRSFGLSLAAVGFLCACVVGVIYLNILHRKGKVQRIKDKDEVSGSVTIEMFQDKNEIPVAESVDKLSVQVALIMLIYLVTFLAIKGVTEGLELVSPGLAKTVGSILWGFNFIVGSLIASLACLAFRHLRHFKVMNHQYQNNYLLSRLSGLAFDVMIIAGIASINIDDLSGYWLPFVLMAIAGAVVTLWYLQIMCKKLYGDYYYEGLLSMFGMLTGTLSSGVLLLREIDPNLETPASDNLVYGSSFGIAFGAPVLLLVSFAGKGDLYTYVVLGLAALYLMALLLFILKAGKKKAK